MLFKFLKRQLDILPFCGWKERNLRCIKILYFITYFVLYSSYNSNKYCVKTTSIYFYMNFQFCIIDIYISTIVSVIFFFVKDVSTFTKPSFFCYTRQVVSIFIHFIMFARSNIYTEHNIKIKLIIAYSCLHLYEYYIKLKYFYGIWFCII